MTRPPRLAHSLARSRLAPALTLLALLAACSKDPAAQLSDARAQFGKGQFNAAVINLKSVLAAKPNQADAHLLLGRSLHELGDLVGAETALRRALAGGMASDEVAPVLAEVLLDQDKGGQVLSEFADLKLAGAQADADLTTSIAEARRRAGSLDDAAQLVQSVLATSPSHAAARLVQARLRAATASPAEAVPLVQRLTAEQPEQWRAWRLLGELLQHSQPEPSDEAIAALTKAVTLHPRIPSAQGTLVASLLTRQEFEAARQRMQQMKAALPGHPLTLYHEAKLAMHDGKLDRAREIFQALLKQAPESPAFLLAAGEVEMRLNSPVMAAHHFAKASALQPQELPPRRLHVQALMRSGQIDRALATLEPLLKTANPAADDLLLAGQAHLLAGRPRLSDALFAKAARDPNSARARAATALARLGKGFDADAHKTLIDIAAREKDSYLDTALISSLIALNRTAEAGEAVASLERKDKSGPLAAVLRGRIALVEGKVDAARAAFVRALELDPAYFAASYALSNMDIAQGKVAQARGRYERLVKATPRHPEALRALGDIADFQGDAAAATDYYERAVAAAPADLTLKSLLLDHHMKHRQVAKALTVAQALASATPDDPGVLSRLTTALLLSGSYQQAIVTVSKWQLQQPRHPNPQVALVVSQIGAGHEREAINAAVKVAERFGQPALFDRAAPALMSIKRPEALTTLAKAVQTAQPNRSLAFIVEGDMAAAENRLDTAVAAYRRAMQLDQPTVAAMRLHRTLLIAGKPQDAAEMAQRWVKERPTDFRFAQHLADQALARGEWADAEAGYRKLGPALTTNAAVLNNLAYAVMKQGKAEALPLATRAVALAPDQPLVLDTQAMTFAAAGEWGKARDIQTRVVGMLPGNTAVRLRLAAYLVKAGDKQAALTHLKALAAMPLNKDQQAELDALQRDAGAA